VVVISVGRKNPYGHPDPTAMRDYATKDQAVFRTDRYGTVWISAAKDGGFTVETERSPPGDTLPRRFDPEVHP